MPAIGGHVDLKLMEYNFEFLVYALTILKDKASIDDAVVRRQVFERVDTNDNSWLTLSYVNNLFDQNGKFNEERAAREKIKIHDPDRISAKGFRIIYKLKKELSDKETILLESVLATSHHTLQNAHVADIANIATLADTDEVEAAAVRARFNAPPEAIMAMLKQQWRGSILDERKNEAFTLNEKFLEVVYKLLFDLYCKLPDETKIQFDSYPAIANNTIYQLIKFDFFEKNIIQLIPKEWRGYFDESKASEVKKKPDDKLPLQENVLILVNLLRNARDRIERGESTCLKELNENVIPGLIATSLKFQEAHQPTLWQKISPMTQAISTFMAQNKSLLEKSKIEPELRQDEAPPIQKH